MILYKYLTPSRIDVLEKRRIRFTQPSDLNDPFEFRPALKTLFASDTIDSFMANGFDKMVDDELAKFGSMMPALAKTAFPEFIAARKKQFPELLRVLDPKLLEELRPRFTEIFNRNIGVLCLSEVPDSLLMWGHYTANHSGFVVGFDTDDPIFRAQRTKEDEFGILRKVIYSSSRPNVTLTTSDSEQWFHTKSLDWAYEKEWRILRALPDADEVISTQVLPIHLFGFGISAIREVIFGTRTMHDLKKELRFLARQFPKARLFQAEEHSGEYALMLRPVA